MAQTPDLEQLARTQPDPEVFRRVWSRVMPDQKNSPIVLSPAARPGPQTPPPPPPRPGPQTPPPPGPARPPVQKPPARPPVQKPPARPPLRPPQRPSAPPPPPQPREAGGADLLPPLMDLAREGEAASAALARRAGNQGRPLFAMAAGFRQAQKRLSAAYFLETGRRYQPKALASVRGGPLPQALRERFLWEQDWSRTCVRTAERAADPSLQALCRDLAREGEARRRTIRELLERLQT